jgi:hypothetical protein
MECPSGKVQQCKVQSAKTKMDGLTMGHDVVKFFSNFGGYHCQHSTFLREKDIRDLSELLLLAAFGV